ncbi:hypothetical protein G7046_g9452 [Stylonectria norvegica]|nr:hypothetical protein G7046_g9452 [Stylonectria norvegica]
MSVPVLFKLVRSENPRAADILAILSVLETSSVPEALLYHPENETPRSFHAAIRRLRELNLVQVSDAGTTLFLDAQIQSQVRVELQRQHALSKWERVAIKILSRAFPSGDSSYWRACDVLMPHVRKVLACEMVHDEGDGSRMKHAMLLRNVASFLEYRGDFRAALDKLNDALKLYGSDDGLDDERPDNDGPDNDIDGSGNVWFNEKTSHILAVEANVALRSVSNVDAFNIRNNLAGLYVDMGDYRAAESEHREILADQERTLGPTHHNTIYTRRVLAKAISAQGHYAAAKEMHEAALTAAEQVLGLRHPDTVLIKSDLAQLAEKLGDFTKSEMLHRDVLECRLQGFQAENAAVQKNTTDQNAPSKTTDTRVSVINSQLGLGKKRTVCDSIVIEH